MEEKKVNYWKWAFFVLVGILFISGCYLATKVTSQTKEQTNIAKVSDKNSKQKYRLVHQQFQLVALAFLHGAGDLLLTQALEVTADDLLAGSFAAVFSFNELY